VYAQGAVELHTGGFSFRASECYVDARRSQALLVEPSFDTQIPIVGIADPVPLFVRAERARVVASGLAVFDRAHLSTSRATDALTLDVTRLTVEEYGKIVRGDKAMLGFRTDQFGSQRFTAEDIRLRGERMPLLSWPRASFGGGTDPIQLDAPQVGSRSSLGYFGLFGVHGRLLESEEALVTWNARAGGYSERGPALGFGLDAKTPEFAGRLVTFGVWDYGDEDRSGYDFREGGRGLAELEARWDPTPEWRLDVEANVFSDRGFNREYFEGDERNHKDRETYARLRWMRGGTAATLTWGFHARPFMTETLDQPTVALWSESVPLTSCTSRIPLDLSSAASFGRLAKRFDEDLPDDDYEAWRLDVTERVYAPFDLGDVRVSPFVGVRCTGYYDRTDGGDDVTRGAMEAGIRANLQLHRDFPCYGGPWSLDGLRHVIDLDAGGYARFLGARGEESVPEFDRLEPDEDRTEVFLEARTRLETRRVLEGRRGNATLLDARALLSLWPDRVGPYGQRGTGELLTFVQAEVVPGTAWIRADSTVDLDVPRLEHATGAFLWTPCPDLALSVGLRHVHHEFMAPWFDAWWRWDEKWAIRASAIRDFSNPDTGSFRATLFRISEDHAIEAGLTLRNGGRDVGFVLELHPAVGGVPVDPPFSPHDTIDYRP
jgi:hypothetical protein